MNAKSNHSVETSIVERSPFCNEGCWIGVADGLFVCPVCGNEYDINSQSPYYDDEQYADDSFDWEPSEDISDE